MQEPNYVKEVLTSQWNLAFVGLMFLLMVFVNFAGFAALLAAGEIAAVLIAQLEPVKHYIRLRSQIEDKQNLVQRETEIVAALPAGYQTDFQTVARLCCEIEDKWKLQGDKGGNYLLEDLVEKLGNFRFEYARMLQAHFLTANRNLPRLVQNLQAELKQAETNLQTEKSPKVREVMQQNSRIIKQRLQRTTQLSDLVRLLEARLAVVKNSLSLLQDEIFTFADPTNVSDAVDNLLLTLNIDDELKTTYEDVLSVTPEPNQTETTAPDLPQNKQRQTNLRRVK